MTAGPPSPAPAARDRGPDPARGSAVPAGPRSPAPAGLFRAFIVRSLRQQPLRSAATIASLAVGVAVVVAIQLANVSSVRGFSTALDALAGRTSLELAVPGVGLDETRLADLGWLREYGLVSPVIDADVLLEVTPDGAAPALEAEVGLGAGQGPAGVTADGTAPVIETVRLLGVDILRDRPFRDYPLVAGDAPRPVTTQDFLDLLTDPRAVVLTRPFTRRHGLAVGDGVTLVAGDRTTRLRVAGILGDEGPARALDGNFALMDVAAAQWALDRLGRLDRVDLRLADGVDVARAEAAIAARLPAGITVRRPSSRGAEVERMLRAFQFNLTALSLIALLVGLFLVYNTVSVSVITRRSEIGLLRTLGVTRRAVVGLFLGEAGALAVLGCALGAPLGWLAAHGAVRLTSSTVSQFWIASSATVPPLEPPLVGLAFAVGLPLALAAAAAPALEAARLTPLAAVRGDDDLDARARLPRRWIAGPSALFAAGAWCAAQDAVGGLPVFGMLAALAVVLGAGTAMPAVLFGFRRACGAAMARGLGVEGRLAHANLGGAIPRLSISVAALAVSLAMMTAVAIMVGSFRETVVYWIGQTLQADLFVSTARRSPAAAEAGMSAAAEAVIARHPAVEAVDGFTGMDVPYRGSTITVGAGRFATRLERGGLQFKAPADGAPAMAGAVGRDRVVVSEAFSLKYEAGVGDRIHLPAPAGPAPFEIAAVYFDYSSDRGLVVMDAGTFERHFGPRRPSGLTVYLTPGADPETVRDELRAALGPERRLFITTNAALRANVLRIFDATFAITYALEVIAIGVSLFGMAATLLTLVLERRREIAMLRLVGADSRQLRRLIVVEAGVLGALTQAVGLAVGLALSLILIHVVNVQSFGWTIRFHLPAGFLAQATAAVVAAAALAGLYPARLAARFDLADAGGGNG